MQSWIHVIDWRANVHPQVTALTDDRGAAYTYAELRTEVERTAGGWAAAGVGPGDIVAVVAKNSADFLVHATADACVYENDARTLYDSLAAADKTLEFVKADHYLLEPAGARERAADLVAAWTADRE